MKSRGCYETPGGYHQLKGHRAIESITPWTVKWRTERTAWMAKLPS